MPNNSMSEHEKLNKALPRTNSGQNRRQFGYSTRTIVNCHDTTTQTTVFDQAQLEAAAQNRRIDIATAQRYDDPWWNNELSTRMQSFQ